MKVLSFYYFERIMLKNIRNMLLNFMMAWRLFWDDKKEQGSKTHKQSWNVFETKTDYISEVSWFLKDGVEQMKKDLSLW